MHFPWAIVNNFNFNLTVFIAFQQILICSEKCSPTEECVYVCVWVSWSSCFCFGAITDVCMIDI